MKTVLYACWLMATWQAIAQPAATEPTRFAVIDLYVDSGQKPLAAYQLEFGARSGNIVIAGIEGGDHPAFREPPFYDPEAMQHDRVILAAFNPGPVQHLPHGRTRVASVHLEIRGKIVPQFEIQLQTAASVGPAKTAMKASFEQRTP